MFIGNMQEHTYNHIGSLKPMPGLFDSTYAYNIKIITSSHGAKHVSKCAMQSWASHQPNESHLVINSEL